MKQKTCPKSLQYKARANIPPDDIFQKEIRAIKNNAEQQFVSALVRFHKRRSQSHAKKLNRAKTARTRNSTDADISHQETQSSEHNVKNDVNRIDNLEKQISRIETILCKHLVNNNKRVESYQSVISEKPAKHSTTTTSQSQTKSIKRKHRRLNTAQRRTAIERETNEKYLKNLSDTPLTDDQVGVISKGLKFIPTPVTDKNKIRQQLLRDFEQFARRMRLRYMFHGKNKEPHPFHVKSNWTPPIQPSVALESYLEHVKVAISEINIEKPKYNLSRNQHAAVKELKNNAAINLKRADKGSTTVILNKTDKIQEAKVQLNNRDHYLPLEEPMVSQTLQRVNEVITQLHKGNHIDDMTKKWLTQTPNPPRIPIFYTLTKIHKPKPVGRPIISGCEGPTAEKISSFVDSLLQPIS